MSTGAVLFYSNPYATVEDVRSKHDESTPATVCAFADISGIWCSPIFDQRDTWSIHSCCKIHVDVSFSELSWCQMAPYKRCHFHQCRMGLYTRESTSYLVLFLVTALSRFQAGTADTNNEVNRLVGTLPPVRDSLLNVHIPVSNSSDRKAGCL